jgi:hypothetical protein
MSKPDEIKMQDLFIEGHSDIKNQEAIPYTDKSGDEPVNILSHLSREQLLSNVEKFVKDKALEEHVDDIWKGALLAQNPTTYQELEELSDADKEAIQYENTHRWSQPLTLYLTIAICSLGKQAFVSILRYLTINLTL